MTTITLTPEPAGDQTSVSLTTKLDGYTIKWAAQNTGERVEIWQNTSNNRATATKVATVADTYYDSPTLTVGTTYYIWTRRLSVYDTVGDWDLGVSAGRTVTVAGVAPNNIGFFTGTALVISPSVNAGATVPSLYNTWTETGSYVSFTTPASGRGKIRGFIFVDANSTSVVTSGSSGFLQARLRVRNQSAGVNVAGQYYYTGIEWILDDGSVVSTGLHTFNVEYKYGFEDGLLNNTTYRVHLDLQKTRTGADLTYGVEFGVSLNSFAVDSVSF